MIVPLMNGAEAIDRARSMGDGCDPLRIAMAALDRLRIKHRHRGRAAIAPSSWTKTGRGRGPPLAKKSLSTESDDS
jgi:hypothetical protein